MQKTEKVIHSRESGLRFTQIIIKKVGRVYVAEFEYWFDKDGVQYKPLLTTAPGKNAKECIKKVEDFFKMELDKLEYTISERFLSRDVIKKLEFSDLETFGSMYKAQEWCNKNGYSYGSSDGNNPVAIWKGQYAISKWHNLSIIEKGSCDAVLMCDREGPAFIYIFK